MTEENSEDMNVPDATELMDHDQERLDDIVDNLQAVNSQIANIELQIHQLKQQKKQLIEKKEEYDEKKEDRFKDLIGRYDLDVSKSYTYQNGKIIEQEDQQLQINSES